MKASYILKLTESILNEDKFSKYTLQQIYDELGEEDFLDYIENYTRKALQNTDIKTTTDLKTNSTERNKMGNLTSILFTGTKEHFFEKVTVTFNLGQMNLTVDYTIKLESPSRYAQSGFQLINSANTDVSSKILNALKIVYNKPDLRDLRERFLGLIQTDVDTEELRIIDVYEKLGETAFTKLLKKYTKDTLKKIYEPVMKELNLLDSKPSDYGTTKTFGFEYLAKLSSPEGAMYQKIGKEPFISFVTERIGVAFTEDRSLDVLYMFNFEGINLDSVITPFDRRQIKSEYPLTLSMKYLKRELTKALLYVYNREGSKEVRENFKKVMKVSK